MTLQISTTNEIIIDGKWTGLRVKQARDGTVVYTPEFESRKYREHKMPHVRYSTAHPAPSSGVPGCDQFESDIRRLLETL